MKFCFLAGLTFLVVGCSNNFKKVDLSNVDLGGKLFLFGPSMDSANCETKAACDCCAFRVAFISEEKFLMESYCEGSGSYFTGNYKTEIEQVILDFDSLYLDRETNWQMLNDSIPSPPGYLYEWKSAYTPSYMIKGFQCGDQVGFFDDLKNYGHLDKGKNLNDVVTDFRNDSIHSR